MERRRRNGWREGNRERVRHQDVAALGTAAAASEDPSLTTQCERMLPKTTAHKCHDQREDM